MGWVEKSASTGLAGLVLAAFASAAALAEPTPDPPLPPARPDRSAVPAPGSPQAPRDSGSARAASEGSSPRTSSCPDRLAQLGVRFEERRPVRENACGVDDAVLVSGLPDGIAVKPPALMTCPLAEKLAHWTLETVTAEADRQLAAAVTGILIGTSYECRNQRSGSKLSEHAFGNAVDVMAFEFKRRGPVNVTDPENSPEGAFRIAVQRGACSIFTTVLGPGSDAAHANHLHLDMRGRRGDYRICQ
jgi:hypothetical protein